jgi:hypothetical protein
MTKIEIAVQHISAIVVTNIVPSPVRKEVGKNPDYATTSKTVGAIRPDEA